MKLQFSIAALLGVMVPLAVGLTALSNPTIWWEGTVFVLTMALLLVSVIGICYRTGMGRAFWLGFCVFAWGIVLLSGDNIIVFRPYGGNLRSWYSSENEPSGDSLKFLVETLVDKFQLARRILPRSVGEKVQVQWGGPSSYYPASILEIKDDLFKDRKSVV